MLQSIQGKLRLLFSAFVALVVISVGAMYWGLETQRQDALVINLAGRQRMLVEQMTRFAMQWVDSGGDDGLAALREAESTFGLTLSALREGGGNVPYLPEETISLPATRDPEILTALDGVNQTWAGFRATLRNLTESSVGSSNSDMSLQAIQNQSTVLLQQTDEVVRAYQAASAEKVTRLRAIQIGFLVSALLLLAVGGWVINRSVILPLNRLERVAERIGKNDLDAAVLAEGPREMRLLALAFETMRGKLLSSRTELVELAESLEQRVSQRTRELNVLNEISREITSRLDVQQVLDSVTEKACSLLDGEVAALCLMDESGQWLNLNSLSGSKDAVVAQRTAMTGMVKTVLGGTQAQLCSAENCVGGCGILTDAYRKSHVAAPLRVGDRVIGALCVGMPVQNRYSSESSNLLTKLANTAAIALENARLYNKAEHVATLEERRRIAAEMHDGLAQTLGYLGLSIDQVCDFLETDQDGKALQHLQQTRLTIRQAADDVRRAIDQLIDKSPLPQGLLEQMEGLVREFSIGHGLAVDWQAQVDGRLSCSRPVLEQVMRIAREALINAAMHAQADRVRVCFDRVNGNFQIVIQDNGRGFTPDLASDTPRRHFGLQIMQARAEHIGGQVQVRSEPGAGTRVTLTWPAKEDQK